MQDHDLDAPNLETVREPQGKSRLFFEDDPPMSVEDDASMSVRPSVNKRASRASAVLLFMFVVVKQRPRLEAQRASRLPRLKVLPNSSRSLNPSRLISPL